MHPQIRREELETNVLALMAKTYLADPVRVANVLSTSKLTPEHFSDAVARDVFRQLLPGILARNLEGERLNALRILASPPDVEGNLEEAVAELSALGPFLEGEAHR
jgi:hypothetical protein